MHLNKNSAVNLATGKTTTMRVTRNIAFAGLVLSMTALASCGTPRSDADLKTASIENDYRVRHPITMAEAEHAIDIPIGSGDYTLSIGNQDTIRGFAQDYATNASGAIQISVPYGSVNSGAVNHVLPQIRKVLVKAGIKPQRIIMGSYSAPADGVSAPVHLSFVAITAMTDECGQWPADLMNNSMENKNWYNFGCASQNNLAAQVANPKDLFDPRGQTPIDAERRSQVISDYHSNGAIAGN
jgi:pilus assembly protein CpaD